MLPKESEDTALEFLMSVISRDLGIQEREEQVERQRGKAISLQMERLMKESHQNSRKTANKSLFVQMASMYIKVGYKKKDLERMLETKLSRGIFRECRVHSHHAGRVYEVRKSMTLHKRVEYMEKVDDLINYLIAICERTANYRNIVLNYEVKSLPVLLRPFSKHQR